ncbi:unnamed protein product [Cladocopium goreaui]|uniref:Mitogen-activated protein kinase n=1 Tax=Cladocopium goreaui TaxID=2562237 RepID=A0A9P1FK44_9DINO|nr:unnamed protein product [Cladocopium goreaui]
MTCDFPIEISEKYAVRMFLEEPEAHLLGAGAYGEVFLVRRVGRAEESTLALKRCFDCLVLDDPATLKRTYREIAVLRQARHTNIVALKDVVLPKTGCDLYLVFELASQDLERAIRYNLFDEISRRRVSYDVASGLNFLHLCGLMHRDVKPSNILLDDSGRAKLCDFGFVRYVSCASSAKAFTEYVGMRWYRAPELLLGSTSYNQNIDVWSFGCVVAEMALGRPLISGMDAEEQLGLIVGLCLGRRPTRSEADILCIQPDHALCFVRTSPLGPSLEKKLSSVASSQELELLRSCLKLSPAERSSAAEILQNPLYTDLQEAETAPAGEPVRLIIDEQDTPPELILKAIEDEVQLLNQGKTCPAQERSGA